MFLFFATYLFPDENGSFPVDARFIVVVNVKLWEQDLIFISSQSSLERDGAQSQCATSWKLFNDPPLKKIVLQSENKEIVIMEPGNKV